MSILAFNQYIRNITGRDDVLQDLSTEFIKSPVAELHRTDTKCEPSEYKEHLASGASKLTAATSAIAERMLVSLLFSTDVMEVKRVFNLNPNRSDFSHIYYLFLQTARFQLFKMGNCSERSCYASIQLIQHIQDRTIKVVSNPSKDHFFVSIGDDYIYDPHVNPLFIFKKTFHDVGVIGRLPNVPFPKNPYSLVVTKELAQQYFTQWPKIKEKITTLLSAKLTVRELYVDPQYHLVLQRSKVKRCHYKKITDEAFAKFTSLVKNLNQDLSDEQEIPEELKRIPLSVYQLPLSYQPI